MAKQVRYLVQIVPHLEERYGAEKTQAIMQKALGYGAECCDFKVRVKD